MDKMDRLLKLLPRRVPAADLSTRIRAEVHRRHMRRVLLRHVLALGFGLSGLVLASPIFVFLNSDWFSSDTSWLLGSLNVLNMGSVDAAQNLWNGMTFIQTSIGSSLVISVLGIVLMAFGMFFELDRRVFQPPL